MKFTPTVGSNLILFGAEYAEVIRILGRPDSEESLKDFKSHPKGRRNLKYGDFSVTLGFTVGVFGMGIRIRDDTIYLWDTKINEFTTREFTILLASHGAISEKSPPTAWGSCDIFSADQGILAYFANDMIYDIQLTIPYSIS